MLAGIRIAAIAILWLALAAGMAAAQALFDQGWAGFTMRNLEAQEAAALGWPAPRGAKVLEVYSSSPAQAAGVTAGDIVLSFGNQKIENYSDLISAIRDTAAGAQAQLVVLREGREMTLNLRLGSRPGQYTPPKPQAGAPLPMLDTGGHMAKVSTILFTPDGKQLISASDDKTIRVWDLATGKTLRTILGESGPGTLGKVYALALSPGGKWLAAAGSFGDGSPENRIRLYDFASGKLTAALNGHEDAVNVLAFSPDGRYLLSGGNDGAAIVWDAAERKVLSRLHQEFPIMVAGFTPDSARAVTGCLNGELRLWRIGDGASLAAMTGHQHSVFGLGIASDGTIASADVSEIRLWDGRTGAFLKTLSRQGSGTLAFSPDGKMLLSGRIAYQATTEDGHTEAHVYDRASGAAITSFAGHTDVISAVAFSPDGRWAATGAGNGVVHIWDPQTGKRRTGADGQPLALIGSGRPVWAAGFSRDGREIAWGYRPMRHYNDLTLLEYAMTLPGSPKELTGSRPLQPAAAEVYRRAADRQGKLVLAPTRDATTLDILDTGGDYKRLTSIERDLSDGQIHRSVTFAPDGEKVISGGSNGVLGLYGIDGWGIGFYYGHESEVWAVTTSPDGRYLLSASHDQTVRLWNLKTRELIISLFQGTDGEWVIWTPQGFFASSPAGAKLIGWQINRGPDHEAEYVTAAQLRKHLNRPDIVARAIQLASAEAALREAQGVGFSLAGLSAKPVPRLRVVSPQAGAALKGGRVQVLTELGSTPDPVKVIRVQVNGRQVVKKMPPDGAGFQPGLVSFDVPLAKGANKIAIAAVNGTGETVATVNVTHDGNGELDKRGTLHILAIGVDKYPNLPGKDLRYSGADAKSFSKTMERRAGTLHAKVVKRILVSDGAAADAPTTANILDALRVLRQTGQNDTVMVFVAGHGITEGPDYRFVPADAAWAGEGILRESNVVSWQAFQEALVGANGRRILFLDTCHAESAFNPRLLSDSYEANIMVYSSARGDQEALEDGSLSGGHGLFTYALVQGVNGAARDGAGEVRADGLRDFVRGRVRTLAAKFAKEQDPQYFRARDAENYVLARLQ